MLEFVSFRGLRSLDPHQGFVLDLLEASRQPSQTPFLQLQLRPPPPHLEIPGSATADN